MKFRRIRILGLAAPLLIGVACGQPSTTARTSTTPGSSQAGVISEPSSTTTITEPESSPTTSSLVTTTTQPTTTTTTRSITTTTQATLSNNDYYTNVDGNAVHSPAYSSGGAPAGATAQCRDGSYSFSQHRSGTCSSHGGVGSWL